MHHPKKKVETTTVSIMEFSSSLTEAILLKRHQRFLVDIAVTKMDRRTIYCANSAALNGCDALGSRIWFSTKEGTSRKYPDTWELVEVDGGHLVCVNPNLTTPLVLEALEQQSIEPLVDYKEIVTDYVNPDGLKNFDITMKACDNSHQCFIEMVNVTMGDEIHRGFFPDHPSKKACDQVQQLINAKEQGHRAVLLFVVMHTGIERLFPADHIDPQFGQLLRDCDQAGVECLAYRMETDFKTITLDKAVDVCIPKNIYGTLGSKNKS